jgi:ABC-type phosphate transport system substrate-binding protein
MKRLVTLLLLAGVLLAVGCGGGAEDRNKNSSRDKPKATRVPQTVAEVARSAGSSL